MSSTTTNQNGTGLPSGAVTLGVDARGATHHYSPFEGRVWATVGGKIVFEQSLPSHAVEDYLDHVADTRGGWDDLRYSTKPVGALLVEMLDEAGVFE